MRQPLVSVIVPVFKVEAYLSKCVGSILNQTYTNLEIWLVDDGSPDNCGKICDEWANRDSRIRVIHKENGGLSDARNSAIDIATGEWITFIDSDDYVSPDYVEILLMTVLENGAQISVGEFAEFYEGCELVVEQLEYEELTFDAKKGVEQMFYQELFDTAAWCKMYHRSLFANGIRYPKGILYEDLPTTYRLMLKAQKVVFFHRKIYYYLLRKTSIEGQAFSVKKLDSALYIVDYIQKHNQELQGLERAVRCRMLSFCLHILLEMPAGYPDGRKQVLIDYVKRNRLKVIFDQRARKKARMGAVISYFGLETAKKALARVKARNKQR